MALNPIISDADGARPAWLDNVAAFVICTLTVMFCIISIGPYFDILPPQGWDDANQKAVINNLFIAVLSFFIGGSVANRKKDDTIGVAISTAAKAQDALSPSKDADVVQAQVDKTTITAKDKSK